MKISLFVLNLHQNPIVRAWPLASALKSLGHEIEILGFIPKGKSVYQPYKDKIDYKLIEIERFRDFFLRAKDLADMATGDVIYCCKPNLGTILPSAIASCMGWRKRLLLDVEDNELWTPLIPRVTTFRQRLKSWWIIKWKILSHFITIMCRYDATVVSKNLQARYGGKIVLHGPDESFFNPELPQNDSEKCKTYYNLQRSLKSVIFAGIPHYHKGFDILVDSVKQSNRWQLVLVGDPDSPDFLSAKEQLGERCTLIGILDNNDMPRILAAIEVVAVPQRLTDFTRFQIPAKMLEGMAMEKAVIVSNVSDLPEIVGYQSVSPRGWVVDHDSVSSLVKALADIEGDPDEARKRSINARQYFINSASASVIKDRLNDLINAKKQ